jgi:hypothetical protein
MGEVLLRLMQGSNRNVVRHSRLFECLFLPVFTPKRLIINFFDGITFVN